MQYCSSILPNGLQIVYLFSDSNVSYCGFAVNAGARDETPNQHGLAHFVEHTLFKGTKKRKAWHILNRMENVGGELDAYTSKEETLLYTVCLSEDVERAVDLLADLVYNSQFPEPELEKEREVILDEINSYLDTPSELIFDEFENLVFDGNELGHNILGDAKSLETFTQESCKSFTEHFYCPANMVFFFYGNTPFKKILHLANKYMSIENQSVTTINREAPLFKSPKQIIIDKNLHQTHVVVGGKTYSVFDERRTGLHLLNNILGGPGMNSRLNMSLREKHGLVYSVESGLTSYTDAGLFTIYFGCDRESESQCLSLTYKELKRLRDNKLSTSQFAAAIKQWKGQLGIMSEQRESLALRLGKSFMRFNNYDDLPEIYRKIDALTANRLLEIANEVYDENRLFRLIYQ
ncbi:MAG: insulinase family protein [Dysgonamonadaceae bacterium]|jgi:predicted Zn-dependent peptidase|nr:insulinase family protein [Dysgonamonadaceae bacterium]